MGGVTFRLEGYDEFVRTLQRLPSKVKRQEINKILRRQAKPVLTAVKLTTPVEKAGRTVTRRTKDGGFAASYKPGNLRDSHKIITGRKGKSKLNPTVYVGPNVKRNAKFDGYYGFFVERGTNSSSRGAGQRAQHYIAKAAAKTEQFVGQSLSKELVRYLDKKARELQLK